MRRSKYIAGIDEEFDINDYNKPKDGLVRRVGISFKNKDGDDHEDLRHSVVERPARACVKLMNIEDASILDDMRKLDEEILDDKVESDTITDVPEADDVSTDSKFGKYIEEVPHDVGSCPDLTSQLKSPVNLKTPLYSVNSKNSSEVVWPAVQLEEDVGGVTAAIPANDKAMVAGGEQIQRLAGAGLE